MTRGLLITDGFELLIDEDNSLSISAGETQLASSGTLHELQIGANGYLLNIDEDSQLTVGEESSTPTPSPAPSRGGGGGISPYLDPMEDDFYDPELITPLISNRKKDEIAVALLLLMRN